MRTRPAVIPAVLLTLLAGCGPAPGQALAERSGLAATEALPSPSFPVRPDGPLLDAANVFAPDEKAALDARLRAGFTETGHPVVVVTVPSLDGPIEKYALDLFNGWGIGAREKPGVLIVLAPHERRVRIATGLGLERVLPDALCARIIAQDMLPPFRRGEYLGGVEAGVEALFGELSAAGSPG